LGELDLQITSHRLIVTSPANKQLGFIINLDGVIEQKDIVRQEIGFNETQGLLDCVCDCEIENRLGVQEADCFQSQVLKSNQSRVQDRQRARRCTCSNQRSSQ